MNVGIALGERTVHGDLTRFPALPLCSPRYSAHNDTASEVIDDNARE